MRKKCGGTRQGSRPVLLFIPILHYFSFGYIFKTMIKLKVILGSTREGRFGDKPAKWIADKAKEREGVEVELLDLRDYPMPFFKESVSPSYATEPYSDPVVQKWTAKIAEADAYVIATPEYNHSTSAVLKNAMDYVYRGWNRKPAAFIAWGSTGGARAVEQLRQVAAELQMAPVRDAVHIQWPVLVAITEAKGDPASFAPVDMAAKNMLDQLLWWANALQTAREQANASVNIPVLNKEVKV